MGGPLEGVRVVDLSRVLTGPYCSMMLADLGAEVIKIERPGSGDDTREWGPPFLGGESAYFMSVNRNKKSLTLDLKSDRGREVLHELVAGADVVLENFRPGIPERLGADYDTLSTVNERLVYCSITGFGQDGPYRDRPGYDLILQGMGGLMGITGPPGGEPVRVGVAVADIGAGMFAAHAITSALFYRERTGEGQYIDTAMLDGQVAWMTYMAGYFFATGEVPRRRASAHPTIVPYQAFETADGYINIAVGTDELWRKFARLLGMDPQDPRYETNARRVENRNQLVPAIQEILREHPSQYWLDKLGEAGVPAGPINTLEEVFSDPQVEHRDMVVTMDHPTAGEVRATGVPVKFSKTPGSVEDPPPLLGQHNRELLTEMGYTEEEIDSLEEDGVV